jgi:DNA-binding LacI/PurR family transcriptional regulator
MPSKPRKITQREIARIAGVSQTTVSMVLNDREGSNVRIPEATRARVREAIERSTYVADPAARRLAGLDNQIIGVFTYEPALSPESMDFYGPLLNGIERSAEALGCDLLFFTGSPVQHGKRRLFHRKTRLRLADGCILLGQEMDGADLERLVNERFPFVAVGRRDETSARVPYVGIDYAVPTVGLIDRAVELGHDRAVYVHRGRETPTARDRLAAVQTAATANRVRTTLVTDEDLTVVAGTVRAEGATLVLAEDAFLAEDVVHALRTDGLDVPGGVSVAALAEVRGHRIGGRVLTGFHVPRGHVAAEALALLQRLITTAPEEWDSLDTQRLLSADLEAGETVVERREA